MRLIRRLAFILVAIALSTGQVPAGATPVSAAEGAIRLMVDASDVGRRILRVTEEIPTRGGEQLVLLYPMWLPGNHAPRGPLQNLAGLNVSAAGTPLAWRRDPVNVAAFRVAVPPRVRTITVSFEFLAPLSTAQGRLVITRDFLNLQWNTVLLYPADRDISRLAVAPRLVLPEGWSWRSALAGTSSGTTAAFGPVMLDRLVDSPLYAGRHRRSFELDEGVRPVRLHVFAGDADALHASEAQIALHREMIRQADLLFGWRPFDRYDFLLTLAEGFGASGTEHRRSSENRAALGYFRNWDEMAWARTLLAHEYVHGWNGKFRIPRGTFTRTFNEPTRNDLLWVYEGLSTYYGTVLAARSGLLSQDEARALLALNYARFAELPGRQWRSLQDTTNSVVLSSRRPLPWPSYQRYLDYYDEGALVWLEADLLIRSLSAGRRSLDDFMRAFFAGPDGDRPVSTYRLDDVVAALTAVQPYDWRAFLDSRLHATGTEALTSLDGSGYRLCFADRPTDFHRHVQGHERHTDHSFSIGMVVGAEGRIDDVLWGGPAFRAGLAPGMRILGVDGQPYSAERLQTLIRSGPAGASGPVLRVKDADEELRVDLAYRGGLRFPCLERNANEPDRLSAILNRRQGRPTDRQSARLGHLARPSRLG